MAMTLSLSLSGFTTLGLDRPLLHSFMWDQPVHLDCLREALAPRQSAVARVQKRETCTHPDCLLQNLRHRHLNSLLSLSFRRGQNHLNDLFQNRQELAPFLSIISAGPTSDFLGP